jgi:hypothetical protein
VLVAVEVAVVVAVKVGDVVGVLLAVVVAEVVTVVDTDVVAELVALDVTVVVAVLLAEVVAVDVGVVVVVGVVDGVVIWQVANVPSTNESSIRLASSTDASHSALLVPALSVPPSMHLKAALDAPATPSSVLCSSVASFSVRTAT